MRACLLIFSQNYSMCCVNGDTRSRVYSIRERFVRFGISTLSHLIVGVQPPSTCLGLGFAVGEPTTCQQNSSPAFLYGLRVQCSICERVELTSQSRSLSAVKHICVVGVVLFSHTPTAIPQSVTSAFPPHWVHARTPTNLLLPCCNINHHVARHFSQNARLLVDSFAKS